jgi:hypothetical protein
MNRYVTAPGHVTAVDLGPATVIVNYRTGSVETLIGPAARWWDELAATGDTDAPVALDADSASTLLGQLRAAGLIVPARQRRPWPAPVVGPPWEPSWGTHELAAGYADPPRVPPGLAVRSCLALAVVHVVLAFGTRRARMARLTGLLTWATTRYATRPADTERARKTVHAVRSAGLLMPGRVACIEESAAATLALAVSGQRVTWCHGAAADPLRLHAWVETDSREPVAEPPSTLRCAVLRTIPARDHGGEND